MTNWPISAGYFLYQLELQSRSFKLNSSGLGQDMMEVAGGKIEVAQKQCQ